MLICCMLGPHAGLVILSAALGTPMPKTLIVLHCLFVIGVHKLPGGLLALSVG